MKKVLYIFFVIGEVVVIGYTLARVFLGIGDIGDYGYLIFAMLVGALTVIKHLVERMK